MKRIAGGHWLGLLAVAGAPAAHAVPGVDYTLVDHRVVSATGANVTPVKHGSFGVAPGLQTDVLPLIEGAGHAITSVSYDATLGKTGWKVEAASFTGSAIYESSATLAYTDAVALGIVGAVPAGASVTLSIKIDGTFSGSASGGNTGFELSAFGGYAGIGLSRAPDPAVPGMDLVTRTDFGGGLPPTFVSVASGTAHAFTETLTITVPLAALGPAVPVLPPAAGIKPFPFAKDCVPSPPDIFCVSRVVDLGAGAGPVALPIAFAVTDSIVEAGVGGIAGDSVIDQMHTATLSVQTPSGVYFLLESGALAEDPASLFRVLPVVADVPEPGALDLMACGLACVLALRRRRRSSPDRPQLAGAPTRRSGSRSSPSHSRTALLAAVAGLVVSGDAMAQATFTTQALFEGSMYVKTVDGPGATMTAAYDESTSTPFPLNYEPPPGYRFHGEATASGSFVAGKPVLKAMAVMGGGHLSFEKAPDIPFGSLPLVQSSVTLHDLITPVDATLPAGAAMKVKLTFLITGTTDSGPLCETGGILTCGQAYPSVRSVPGATVVVTTPDYDFRGFFAGATPFVTEQSGFNGVPEAFDLTLFAIVRAGQDRAQQRGFADSPGYYNSSGTSDFGHTMRLVDIRAEDALGNPLPGFRLLSSDGTTYVAAPVQEPTTWACLLAGVVALRGWRRWGGAARRDVARGASDRRR